MVLSIHRRGMDLIRIGGQVSYVRLRLFRSFESVHTVFLESIVMTLFAIAAVVGFKSNGWIVVAALASHAST
jgi:hypothetical protein